MAIQTLLSKFNINPDTVNQMVPIINTTVNDGQVTATDQHYFTDNLNFNMHVILLYNTNQHDSSTNCFYNHCESRFNYTFLKDYDRFIHFTQQPTNRNQPSSFGQAITNKPDGTYI